MRLLCHNVYVVRGVSVTQEKVMEQLTVRWMAFHVGGGPDPEPAEDAE